MKFGAVVLTCALALASEALAASNVSARYDGVYTGKAFPTPGMSAPTCQPFEIPRVTIAKGFFGAGTASDDIRISGFITEEGYVSAFMTRPGGQKYPLDGRLEDGRISAGFLEPAAGCAWIVELSSNDGQSIARKSN